ncbi:hypothetical protein [Streptomyces mayteni]
MTEPFRTFVGGREVELPSTIPGIRAALPEERRPAFDKAVDETNILDLPTVLGNWLLDAFPDRQADAIVERLAREEAERKGSA